jgi:hypothetical protein
MKQHLQAAGGLTAVAIIVGKVVEDSLAIERLLLTSVWYVCVTMWIVAAFKAIDTYVKEAEPTNPERLIKYMASIWVIIQLGRVSRNFGSHGTVLALILTAAFIKGMFAIGDWAGRSFRNH